MNEREKSKSELLAEIDLLKETLAEAQDALSKTRRESGEGTAEDGGKTEEALRRYQLLVDQSRDIILFMRREDGRILEANGAAEKTYGYSRDELLNMSIHHLRAPGTEGLTPQQMEIAEERGILFESVHKRKTGETFPVEVSSRGATIDGIRTLVSVIRNITERRQAENAARSAALFPEQNPFPVLRVSDEGILLFANRSSAPLLRLWNCREKSPVPENVFHLVKEALETGQMIRFEAADEEVVFEASVTPLPDLGYANIYCSDITRRKNSEEALRRSEEQYRLAIEAGKLGTWRNDLLTRMFHFDERSGIHYGFEEHDVPFKEVIGRIHGDDLGKVRKAMAASTDPRSGDGRYDMDYRVVQPDGSVRWLSVRALYHFEGEGDARRAVLGIGTSLDVTERKLAEEAVRESREDLNRAQAVARTGSWRLDVRENKLVWSDETYRIFNIPIGTVLTYEYFLAAVHPEDREYVDRKWQSAIRGEAYDIEHRILAGETVKWVREKAELEFGDDKVLNGGFGTVQDITERRRIEEELRRQHEWLRVTLTSIGDAVIATDVHGRITFLNPVAVALTEWPEKDALGRDVQSIFRIINEKTRRPAEDIVSRVLAEGCVINLANNTAVITRGGTEIPIEDSAAPIRDNAGNVTGVVLVFHDVTEKRRARQALRESEDRLRVAIKSAELGTWDFDPVTGALNWSDKCKSIFGLDPRTDVDYDRFLERLHPDDRQRTHGVVQQALDPAGDGRFETEYRSLWPDGTERWVLAGGKAFFGEVDGQRRAVRFIGTVMDITERKEAEQGLQRRTILLQGMNKVLRQSIIYDTEAELAKTCLSVAEELTDSKFGFIGEIDSNGLFYDIALSDPGWTACRMPESTAIRLIHDMVIKGIWGRVLKDEKPFITNDPSSHPDSVGTPDGHPPLRTFLGVPLKDGEKTFGMIALANKESGYDERDAEAIESLGVAFSESLSRRRAQEMLRRAHDELEIRVEERTEELRRANKVLVHEIEVRKQIEGRLRHDEARFEALYRLTQMSEKADREIMDFALEEQLKLTGSPVGAIMFLTDDRKDLIITCRSARTEEECAVTTEPKQFPVKEAGVWAQAVRERKPMIINDYSASHEQKIGLPPGHVELSRVMSIPVFDGNVIVAVAVVGNKKEDYTYADVREVTLLLDGMWKLLKRRQLEETRKTYLDRLEQSNQELQDFAFVASHDLQEPLRKIQAFADRLQDSSFNEKERDYLERMRRAAGRMQDLIQDLLRYSRITTRPEPFAAVDLKQTVEEAVMDLSMLRKETGGSIEIGALPEIEADPVQMRQLFQNLIGNGLKYHGEQKPVIRVFEAASADELGTTRTICVEDNGIGFDEKFLDKIFKPFQRLHGADARYRGTGMGLAICRRIIERHCGTITARSEPGKGSTFVLTIPEKQNN